MLSDADNQELINIIETMRLYWERPLIRTQLFLFIATLILAWLIAFGIWRVIGPWLKKWIDDRFEGKTQQYLQWIRVIIQYITFPILGLVAISMGEEPLAQRGFLVGLLEDFQIFFIVMLLYRFILGYFYAILGEKRMHRYHYRFAGPLFTLLALVILTENLFDLISLLRIRLLVWIPEPITLGALLVGTLGFYFWYVGAGVIKDALHFFLAPQSTADQKVVETSLTIGRYIIIMIGVYVVLTILSFDPTTVAFISGGLSVGIGFGSQEIIGNLISGVLLLFERSLQPGDIVEVEGEVGIVKNLSIRATTVRTRNDIELIVPNQLFLTSIVTNYTGTDSMVRVLLPVGIAYDGDPERARDLLLEVADSHGLVQKHPKPIVRFREFADSSLNFDLGFWLDDPWDIPRVSSDLHFMVWKKFAKHNIEIPFPQRDLHLRSSDVTWETFKVNSESSAIEPTDE